MSLNCIDIIRRVYIHSLVAEKYKEEIDHVKVFNQFEEYFGFNHCVIYVKFKLKSLSNKEHEISRDLSSTFFNSGQEEKFSFRLKDAPTGVERSLSNELENLHYNYICSLLKWYLDGQQIRVEFEPFLNERRLKRLEQKRGKE